MNQLKILEIKRRRYEDKQKKALANAAIRSPVERPIMYILSELFSSICHPQVLVQAVIPVDNWYRPPNSYLGEIMVHDTTG